MAELAGVTPSELTLKAAQRMMPTRVAAKIEEAPSGCWVWTASRDACGYGRIRWDGQNKTAHRVVYELLRGPVDPALTLDHLCRNRGCVNPAHLEPVSLAENIMRGDGVGVRNAAKTHCKSGHEFTPENTYWKRGKRACRECGRRATRRWREKVQAGQ
jgi:hypothetical protein